MHRLQVRPCDHGPSPVSRGIKAAAELEHLVDQPVARVALNHAQHLTLITLADAVEYQAQWVTKPELRKDDGTVPEIIED